MRDYGKISTTIWDSRKFSKVDDDARLLYLYLHTCKSVNSVGCFVLKEGYALADLNWDGKGYRNAMDSLCKASLVGFDSVENLVRIVGFLDFDPFTNPKHAQGAIKIAINLPDSVEKLNVFNDIASCKHVEKSDVVQKAIETLSIAYRYPEPEPEPEPDTRTRVGPADSSTQNQLEIESEIAEPIDQIAQAFEIFQGMAKRAKLAVPAKLSDPRRAKLKARLKDCGGIDGWQVACSKVEASSFCTGGTGWYADLDFMLQEKSFTKLMEGSYDDRSHNNKSGNGSGVAGSATPATIADRAARYVDRKEAERRARGDAGTGEL